jgi:hypothetical protein
MHLKVDCAFADEKVFIVAYEQPFYQLSSKKQFNEAQ